jgi:hypothetical protein
MKRNNEQSEKVYTTLDAYQSGFLTLKNHIPKLIDQNGKIVFCFIVSDTFYRDLEDYNSGALIEASRFAFAIKTLKSQIHSMRKGKENLW